jgi:hypothetical protein
MDNPKTRSSTTCPFCFGEKDRGLIVCWQCSTSERFIEAFAEAFEAVLALERLNKTQN